ncbi:hypothetical protein EPA93_36115 [Ktedonosporobacter rubrisoli]|uniref:Nucleotidyltransferase family protein n=1 Tax=Ktedonosporobacter rubrisoli TaxID=2509675 RepID=A0A4P6JZC6_KTERU|nr:hypothetical protein [Ktedonosporobacter rubrisoli]QBD81109.1 hypothetical protein EPA93_36115 [Ktedonosporobacter rubrisoli]
MKTQLLTEGTLSYFVVSELDALQADGVQNLGFTPYRDGFARAYPTTTPHLETFYCNFARSAQAMILQRAGACHVPWEQTLEDLVQRLTSYNLRWWLIGSAALAVRGIAISPGDLDLATDEAGALQFGEILFDALVGPLEDAQGWISKWFGRAFLHSRVEWAGGIREDADEQGVTEYGPAAASRLETILWRGYQILVPPLDIQLAVNERRGLQERTSQIELAFSRGRSYGA